MLLECRLRGKSFPRKTSQSSQIQAKRSHLGLLERLAWLVEMLSSRTVVTAAPPFMQSVQGARTLRRSPLRWFSSALPFSLRRELHQRSFNLLPLQLIPSSKCFQKCSSDDVMLLFSGSCGRRESTCCFIRKRVWRGLL